MDETKDVTDSSPEETEEVSQETVEEVEAEEESKESAEEAPKAPEPRETKVEKTVPYSRFKEVNDELAKVKKNPTVKTSLDVEDYIDISASLEGLDQKEKEKLAREHKLTGRPLSEIKSSEDFLIWQSGYHAKLERERALKPTGTQPESERKRSAVEQITSAKGLKDQEELLRKYGLYKEVRPRSDRSTIG